MNVKDVFESIAEDLNLKSEDFTVITRAIIIKNPRGDCIQFKINETKIDAIYRLRKDSEGNGSILIYYKPYNTAPEIKLEPFFIDLAAPNSMQQLKEHLINSFLEMEKETIAQGIALAKFREWVNRSKLPIPPLP